MRTKYVAVLGSTMSGLGKGVVTSSILKMLDFYGYKALPIKFDGYLNYDCGTMNPYRHGEVFVLDDKSEVDMDFGIYERFLNKSLTGNLSITGGKLFGAVISKERRGDYLGEDVQIIPHLTNKAIEMVCDVSKKEKPDVVIIEVGGTVGDIENSYFIEALRQLALKEDVVFVNLTYLPVLDVVGEQKTKPAQIGFRLLLQAGIKSNFVVCRSKDMPLKKTIDKLALFANMSSERIIGDPDVGTLYELPTLFMKQGFDRLLIKDLGLERRPINREKVLEWRGRTERIIKPKRKAEIAIVGKYTGLADSYASIKEALKHAGAELDAGVNITWVESDSLARGKAFPKNVDGIIVPGGFGKRGIEGMINAITYARENKIPYLGLCLGMQLMVVEYARNVCLLERANSTEFDKNTPHGVIHILESQKNVNEKGGTMRLGAWKCKILGKDSIAFKAYNKKTVYERHRHRYEFNGKYRKTLEKCGLVVSGVTPDNKLVEFAEWSSSYGIGTQAHPELKSRLESPAPLFVSFLDAALRMHE